jgi:hypothetical protein
VAIRNAALHVRTGLMDASAQQENAKAQRTPQAYIYYWKNYWDDKRKGRVPSLTLHRNSSRMADVRSGDTVWALTRKPAVSRKPSDDTYLIVGHYLVSTVGETPESDPGRIA